MWHHKKRKILLYFYLEREHSTTIMMYYMIYTYIHGYIGILFHLSSTRGLAKLKASNFFIGRIDLNSMKWSQEVGESMMSPGRPLQERYLPRSASEGPGRTLGLGHMTERLAFIHWRKLYDTALAHSIHLTADEPPQTRIL